MTDPMVATASLADAVVVKKPEVYFARPGKPLAITNPVILVEVHSNSTEGYDYAHKLDCDQQLEAVQRSLFVSRLKPFSPEPISPVAKHSPSVA